MSDIGGMTEKEGLSRLALRSLSDLGSLLLHRLVQHFGSAEAVLAQDGDQLKATQLLSEKQTRKILALNPEHFQKEWQDPLVHHHGPGDPLWESLQDLHDPPLLLSHFGLSPIPELQNKKRVAIVGARAASPSDLAFTESCARELAAAGCLVISGLARGIDGAAHRGSLQIDDGVTWALLGHGLDRLYPPEHRGLAQHICQQGSLISEYPLGARPMPYHFPQRNRLIACLAETVIVVRASRRSGSLITAQQALELGREVLAVPGDPWNEQAQGCLDLIKDGAHPISQASDVLELIGQVAPPPQAKPFSGILKQPMTISELMNKLNSTYDELIEEITLLECEGKIKRQDHLLIPL